ncbi:hypothetical protein LTS15_011266 [Exophiala xenobiotica]|nr:hypothetical protein LTS15_011266 [Exophiala xenobiotica]
MSAGYNHRRIPLRIRLQGEDESSDEDNDDIIDLAGDDILDQESYEIGDDIIYPESDETGGEFSFEPTFVEVPVNYHATTNWAAAIASYHANTYAETIQMTKEWEEKGHGIFRPPAHLLPDHHNPFFPLEVPATLGRPDLQPYIPGSDNRFTVGDDDADDENQDLNIKFSTGMSYEIWGIPDEFTSTLEEAYYYYTKWSLLDPWYSQEYVSQREIMQAQLVRLMDRPMSSGNALRALVHRLLKASFREIEVEIVGSLKRGKIVHWYTSPKVTSESLPLSVMFKDQDNPDRPYYQLIRTTLEDVEDPVVRQIGGELVAFNRVEQIGIGP